MSQVHSLSLMLLTGEEAQDGPGWYITGQATSEHQGENIKLRRVPIAGAEEIARTFENLIPTDTEGLHPFALVKAGNVVAAEIIQQNLKKAEEVALTVASLRRALGEFGNNQL